MVLLRERYKLEQPSPERSLVENWETIFGKLAGRCNPLRIKDGTVLIISVTNQTLRAELRFLIFQSFDFLGQLACFWWFRFFQRL